MARAPDEIKKGLEYISIKDIARKLDAWEDGIPYDYVEDAAADALALIQQLEATVSGKEKVVAELSGKIGQLESQNRCFKGNKESCEKRMVDLAQRMPRWISVEERLPETETWVLCWYVDIDGDKWHTVGKLLKDGIWAVDIYETDEPEYYTVTHWMPLPEPPKEDAK